MGVAERRGGRIGRALVAGAIAAALVVGPALPASAHDEIVEATPAAGSTVATAPNVVLTFDEPVLDLARGKDGIAVTDAAGRHYETACALVATKAVSVPVELGIAGVYTVRWHVVSEDGHPVSGSYTFTYAPKAGTAAARGTVSGPNCGDAGVDVAAEAEGVSLPSLLAIAASALVLLAVVCAVVAIAVRSRRRRPED